MSNTPRPKRKYDSTRRKAQARETRQKIAESARSLFFKRGYSGTTINAIAHAARVAPETVYAVFGSKCRILSHLMDISIGGDDQPIHLLDRPEPQEVLHDTDPQRQIRMFSHGITEIMLRAAPLFEVVRTAAKTEKNIAELLQHLLKERLENMARVVEHIARNTSLREGMEGSRAAELIWTITSPEVFLLLTRDLNYSADQYTDWLQSTLIRQLLP
jgi:AcrR family transcriptional regulator